MGEILDNFLSDLSGEKADMWRQKVSAGLKEINEWLDSLKQKYGNTQ